MMILLNSRFQIQCTVGWGNQDHSFLIMLHEVHYCGGIHRREARLLWTTTLWVSMEAARERLQQEEEEED